ncbi:hypothetical protein [Streptococcus hyointestinalis]
MLYHFGIIIVILALIVSPIAFVGLIIALIKKDEDKRNGFIALLVAVPAIIFAGGKLVVDNNPKPAVNGLYKTSTSSKSSSSSSSTYSSSTSSNYKQSSTSTVSSSQSSSSVAPSSSTQTEVETDPNLESDGLPRIDAGGMVMYSTYLQETINSAFQASGLNSPSQVIPSGKIVYVTVPNEYQYESKYVLQQLADTLFNLKNQTYAEFASQYGYSQTYRPVLYLKTQDMSTLIARENLFHTAMKVKAGR